MGASQYGSDEPRALRVNGDPFRSVAGAPVRRLLEQAHAAGFATSLWLTDVRGDGEGRGVPLSDGALDRSVCTQVGDAELAHVWRALSVAVPATAPVVVFADGDLSVEDAVLRAALEWPRARAVLDGVGADGVVLERVAAVQRSKWEVPSEGLRAAEVGRWQCAGVGGGSWVHPCGLDDGWGTVELLGALERLRGDGVAQEVLLLWVDAAPPPSEWVARWSELGMACTSSGWEEWMDGAFAARQACAGWLLPWRRLMDRRLLLAAMVSTRPMVATRAGAMAQVLGAEGVCVPVAACCVGGASDEVATEPRSLEWSLRWAWDSEQVAELSSIGLRARAHGITHFAERPRPLVPVPRQLAAGERPKVVLEAPLWETSSSSELTIETARALIARDNVDVLLVPRVPSTGSVDSLRQRAPDLIEHLSRSPGPCDLWLSSGWPPRVARPDARVHAVRLDWEYGALPVSLLGGLSAADRVIVHSRAVAEAVALAGLSADKVLRVPHGVGAEFVADGKCSARVVEFKRQRGADAVALLFVGGLVWRKGIDVWIRTLLQLHADGVPVCGVIKSMGSATHYAGFHMGDLVRRVQANPNAPPLLHLDQPMERGELAEVYRACDVMLHPYRGEGFGMPVLEAMATGLPIAVTAGGSTDDFCHGPGTAQIPSTRRTIELSGLHMGEPFVLEPSAEATVRQVRALLSSSARPSTNQTWDVTAATLEASLTTRSSYYRFRTVDRAETVVTTSSS